MRNQEQVLTEITAWASGNENVRTVILTSSRAHAKGNSDLFSDYDIEIGVRDLAEYIYHEEWLSSFGAIIAIIREDHEAFSMRLVLYEDYVRIDFKIYAIAYLRPYTVANQLPEHWDIGYRILVDKDEIPIPFPPPAYTAFRIAKPAEAEYIAVVSDFWWDVTYVAKSLWRDELFYAKYMLDNVIRFAYLQKMIEWYIALQHNWEVSTNKYGRFFKQYLDSATWTTLEKTYAGSGIEDNWHALFTMMQLFRELATSIATQLNYSYPQQTDKAISEYLEKIKNLDITATDIS